MAKVIGLGGLFFKCSDPAKTRAWYSRVLGIEFDDWGGTFFLPADAAAQPGAGTVFSPFEASTGYFAPSTSDFMFNLMVDDLPAMVERCKREGVEVLEVLMDEANGHFAHLIDPDGRKLELWEPKEMG